MLQAISGLAVWLAEVPPSPRLAHLGLVILFLVAAVIDETRESPDSRDDWEGAAFWLEAI
jgi:hypothetical protein